MKSFNITFFAYFVFCCRFWFCFIVLYTENPYWCRTLDGCSSSLMWCTTKELPPFSFIWLIMYEKSLLLYLCFNNELNYIAARIIPTGSVLCWPWRRNGLVWCFFLSPTMVESVWGFPVVCAEKQKQRLPNKCATFSHYWDSEVLLGSGVLAYSWFSEDRFNWIVLICLQ